MSWPLRGTSRDTQTTTGRSPSPYRARTPAPATVRPERGRVHPGRQPDEPRPRPVRAGQPDPHVLAQVGDHVHAGADPAQQPAAARQRRPADLVPVAGRDDPLDPGRNAARRRAGPAAPPPRTRPPCSPRPWPRRGPAGHLRGRQQHRGRVPQHRERLGRVELGRPRRGGREHHHRAGRLPDRQLVHERLDAAGPGREVVGDDQRAPHRNSTCTLRRHCMVNCAVPACSSARSCASSVAAGSAAVPTAR